MKTQDMQHADDHRMDYQTATLANGLRLIAIPTEGRVAYCGYAIAAGSRHEEPGEEGLAHFCEHLSFKGTRTRKALAIINRLEQVGGDLNAFTNKEHTVYYAAVPHEHLPRAIDLLTDMMTGSTFPQEEMDKEVEVVCDEIESYNDSPAELIYDEFENLLFARHPLGHNILGEASQLHTYTTADALRFVRRHYRPERMMFFTTLPAPTADHARPGRSSSARGQGLEKVRRLLEKAFARYPWQEPQEPTMAAAEDRTEPSDSTARKAESTLASGGTSAEGQYHERHRGTHQAHVVMGCRAFTMHDPRRLALYLLNNILGGPAMSSRLNLCLRERNALVYSVESNMATYSDTGAWSIYFGCDAADLERCRRMVRRELDRLMQKPLSQRQLRAAKQQLKGQLGIASDNHENYAIDTAKGFLHGSTERNLADLFARIDALTADDLHAVARQLFAPERITTLVYR